MSLSNFLSKFNWRLMVVHFVACWFIYHAINQLGYLYDYKFLKFLLDNKSNLAEVAKVYNETSPYSRLSMDLIYAASAGLGAILVVFIMSLTLCVKHRWLWLNSLIVLLAGIGAFLVDRFYWYRVKFIFMFPGLLFKSGWWFNFVGGLFMLAVGLTLLFWKRIIKFIDGQKVQADEQEGLSTAIQQ